MFLLHQPASFHRIALSVLAVLLCCVLASTTLAQRDAPISNCYLSPIEVLPQEKSLKAKFTLHKTGGPHEHFEHQCYFLLYLAKDEEQIFKIVQDPKRTNKASQNSQPFFNELIDSGVLLSLTTQVSQRAEKKPAYGFPFEIELKLIQLFNELETLKHFSPMNVEVAGKSKIYKDKFRLAVFVPVNDSIYSTEVEPQLRETADFAPVMDRENSILYFRPLPYEFQLRRYEQKLILSIN